MVRSLKKAAVIILIVLGAVVGYWLARVNQRLFELPYQSNHTEQNGQKQAGGSKSIAVGMDTWQVKEVLGPPDERHVISEEESVKKETWIYGSRRLFFTNGFLTSWQGQ
jgi:hypothetical protein